MSLRLAVAAVWLVAGCRGPDRRSSGATNVDDFGDTIRVGHAPARIVSLSPVSTEALFGLGAGARLVGRTHWDLYPAEAATVPDLGDGMQPNVEAVLGARPDLVILYASESNRNAARQLRAAGVPTLALHMDQVAEFRRLAVLLGSVVGDSAGGVRMADTVDATLAKVGALPRPEHPPSVFWFIWESPLYTIGRGSFLHALVEIAGAHNVFGDLEQAAPQVTLEELVRRNPDYIITGPENARRLQASQKWRAVPAVRAGHILVVDTSLVGRPGPRMGQAARHLRMLILGDTAR